MENKKKHLTEENYEKGKKILFKIMMFVLIGGLIIGCGFIVGGIVTISKNSSDNVEETTKKDGSAEKEETKESENTRTIEDIEQEIDEENKNLIKLKAEKSTEFHTNGFSEKYYEIDYEIKKITNKINDLEMEKSKLEINDTANEYIDKFDEVNKMQEEIEGMIGSPKSLFGKGIGGILIMIGISVIIFTLVISGSLFLFYKKREITAFTIQQTMPVAQEGMEKMAPTVGSAVGTIGKEIAKGIKEGLNEADNNKE